VNRFIADTGPIIALLNPHDPLHAWAKRTFTSIEPPVLTCDAVIVEACFLASRVHRGADRVLGLMASNAIRLAFDLNTEIEPVRELIKRYDSVPMSLADARLVRMSELDRSVVVVTIDSDFSIYRRHARQAIPVVMPQ